MASKASYELHHNFPKLADESGFTFNMHRPRMHVDWNKIRIIDINNLIRERKFVIIEQHMNDILNCVLECEFDVRILNEEVLKMFRLAQLAVEYQQFCRHYLDRSVYVLKEEISSLVQELDMTKKNLREREEDIRKLRRKSKHTYRTHLPYGNDNIATMILKTLTNKGDILYPTTSNGEAHHYNRCSHCDKVFLNQLYLKSHILRRHTNAMDIPQKDVEETTLNSENNIENNRMNEEIKELKMKLKEMETIINENKNVNVVHNKPTVDKSDTTQKETKDAEAFTNNEDYLIDKIEEWKKEEHEKYNKEITLLRTQIMETLNSLKDKEIVAPTHNDTNITDQLHVTIREQGTEISALKQELNNSRIKTENENTQIRKETEEQIAIWTKRMETQTKQYDLLLQKLNSVSKEAQETRSLAEKENLRADKLQVMLLESMNRKHFETDDEGNSTEQQASTNHKSKKMNSTRISNRVKKESFSKSSNPDKTSPKTLSDRKTLEKLHEKARELLNIDSISSSSSEVSSFEKTSLTKQKPVGTISNITQNQKSNKNHNNIAVNQPKIKNIQKNKKTHSPNSNDLPKALKAKTEKSKLGGYKSSIPDIEKNGPIPKVQRSPMRLVRSKITEEVNNRLVSAGMDPLKSRLHKSVFQTQRLQLHQQLEEKSKKIPNHEKVRHSILAYLDTTISKKDIPLPDDYVSPDKVAKTFSLTSVLSNVKSKALSLVKSTDMNMKDKLKKIDADVSKKAMTLLKTPPGSSHGSPLTEQHSPNNIDNINVTKINSKSHVEKHQSLSSKHNGKKRLPYNKPKENIDTDSDTSASDHKYYKTVTQSPSSKSNRIDHLIKSPARRPASANTDYNHSMKKYVLDNDDIGLTRTQSAINVANLLTEDNEKIVSVRNIEAGTSDEDESLKNAPLKKTSSEENVQNTKQTKGLLKNASSTSSLNKKKVLFDMDAIQMKSVSASPSQSITEKSDGKEKFELGLINLDGEEWDISSIENEPLKNDTKIQINTRTSPKIAQLKQTIESQLARRNDTPSTVRVGGVDVMGGMMTKASSVGGSNTSLGSSILDDSDSVPPPNHKAFVKSKTIVQKDDSELDISEFSIEGTGNKNESF